jgi:uncharacterized protein YbbK (DUF523 family)
VKLAEVDQKLAALTVVRDTLRAALEAGCDDLLVCAQSPCCPLPFAADSSYDDEMKGDGVACC